MTPISEESRQDFMKNVKTEDLPKFSVVIPSMNQSEFISETLDSIFAQDYPNFEIFIADGGSIDATKDVVSEYQMRYPGKITYSSFTDGSHSAGVKRGIEATTGEVIAWINSDDVYTPGAFWEVSKFFIFNSSEYIVFGDNDYVDDNLEFLYKYPIKHSEKFSEFRTYLINFCQIPQPSLFFRRNLLQYVEGPNSKIIDYEMWLRWSRDFKFNYLPVKLSLSRLHGNSITMNAEKKLLNGIIQTVYSEYHVISYPWVRKKHEIAAKGNFSDLSISWGRNAMITVTARIEWTLLTILKSPTSTGYVLKGHLLNLIKSAKK
jgi:glycosyltransferase involved in cell wall biosynthesis